MRRTPATAPASIPKRMPLVALIDDRNLTTTNLMKYIAGPDFPTGGQLLNSKPELRAIYEAGQGAIRVRGEYKLEDKKRGGQDIVITSIPWAMTKADLVEKIAAVILERKLPYLLDVRDEGVGIRVMARVVGLYCRLVAYTRPWL